MGVKGTGVRREPEHASSSICTVRLLEADNVTRGQEGPGAAHLVIAFAPAVCKERLGVPGAAPEVAREGDPRRRQSQSGRLRWRGRR
eukprot:1361839-Pyramimonas_sp.AAC.1